MNSVILLGRLTADPELKYTQGGTAYVRYTLAVDRPTKKDAEKKTDFIYCVSFGHLAESIAQYCGKGNQLCVNGQLQMEKYTDKDGQNRTTFSVAANRADFIWSGNKEDNAPVSKPVQASQNNRNTASNNDWESLGDATYGDMPF